MCWSQKQGRIKKKDMWCHCEFFVESNHVLVSQMKRFSRFFAVFACDMIFLQMLGCKYLQDSSEVRSNGLYSSCTCISSEVIASRFVATPFPESGKTSFWYRTTASLSTSAVCATMWKLKCLKKLLKNKGPKVQFTLNVPEESCNFLKNNLLHTCFLGKIFYENCWH